MLQLYVKFKKILYFFVLIFCFSEQTKTMQEDDDQQDGQRKSTLYPYLSYFEQRNIELLFGRKNLISLDFSDQPKGAFVSNYHINGMLVGRLMSADNMIHFRAVGQQSHDFLLTSPIKTNLFAVEIPGKLTIRKPIEVTIAFLTCKSIVLLDTFSSEKDLVVQADSFMSNSSVDCLNFRFEGQLFHVTSKGIIAVRGRAEFPVLTSFFNQGCMSCVQSVGIISDSLENYGSLSTGTLNVAAKEIVNKGVIDSTDFFVTRCDSIDNQGKLTIAHDCMLQEVGQLNSSRDSQWNVGRDWKGNIDRLYLDGRAYVGNLALFAINSYANFSGSLHAHILGAQSNGLITCSPHANFFVRHHLGLHAQGWIEYEGDTLEKALAKDDFTLPMLEQDSLLVMYPQGVFLQSERSGIKKSGTIVAKDGMVVLSGNKFVKHTGLTQASSQDRSMIFMNAQSLMLDKDSSLKSSCCAQLRAQDYIEQHGEALIGQQFNIASPKVMHAGLFEVGGQSIINANSLVLSKDSALRSGSAQLTAQDSIELHGGVSIDQQFDIAALNVIHTGSSDAGHHIVVDSYELSTSATSQMKSKTIALKAQQSIIQQGRIDAQMLIAWANFIDNLGPIHSQRAFIKANRWFWNTQKIDIDESLNIDALACLNTISSRSGFVKAYKSEWSIKNLIKCLMHDKDALPFWDSFGWIRAKNLTVNSGINANFLGCYQAQNTQVNSLLDYNAGLYIPQMNVCQDFVTKNNLLSMTETIFVMHAPTSCRMAWKGGKSLLSLPDMGNRTYNLYKQAQGLYGQQSAGISDWIPLLCNTKDLLISVKQANQIGSEIWKTAWPDNNEASNIVALSDELTHKKLWYANEWTQLLMTCGPHMNRSSLLDFDAGINVGVNGNSNSRWSLHTGSSAFVNNYSIDTRSGINTGLLAASKLTISSMGNYSNFGPFAHLYGITGAVSAENLSIYCGGICMADKFALQARKNAFLNTDMSAGNISVQVANAVDLSYSRINAHSEKVTVLGENIKSAANIKSQNDTHIQGKDSVNLVRGSTINAQSGKVNVLGNKIKSAAGIQAQDNIHIQGKDYVDLSYGSEINAQSGKVNVLGQKIRIAAGINSQNHVYIEGQDYVDLIRSGTINAQLGKVTILGENIKSAASIKSHDNVHIQGKEFVDFSYGSEINTNSGKVNVLGNKIMSAVDIKAQNNVIFQAKDILDFRPGTHIDIHNGSLYGVAKKIKNSGRIKVHPIQSTLLNNGNNDVVEKIGSVQFIGTESVSNRYGGDIQSQAFFTCSKFVENAGKINAQTGQFKLDGWLWNSGQIKMDEYARIDALGCLNVFGSIRAKNLAVNTGININFLGCYQAQNANINSLIDFNAGLYLPQINSCDDIFIENNLWMAGDALAMMVAPVGYRTGLKVGKILYNSQATCKRIEDFCKQVNVFYGQKNAGISDLIPLICEAKNLTVLGVSVAQTGIEMGGMILPRDENGNITFEAFKKKSWEITQASKELEAKDQKTSEFDGVLQQILDLSKKYDPRDVINTFDIFDPVTQKNGLSLLGCGASAAGVCGSHMNRSSVFDLDAGINLGINGNSSSLFSQHAGVSGFLNNYSIDTYSGTNSGILASGNLNISAMDDYFNLGQFAHLYGITCSVSGENLDIHGKIRMIDRLSLQARKNARLGVDISVGSAQVQAKNIHLFENNKISVQVASLHATQSIHGDAGNTIATTDHTYIESQILDNQGNVHGALGLNVGCQPIHIGTVDAQGKQFEYQGSLHNGFADQLVDGKGDRMNVFNVSKIAIKGDLQDVHLQEKHDVDHTLDIQTQGSITIDKKVSAKGGIGFKGNNIYHASLQSGTNINMSAKNDVVARSTSERVGNDINYQDMLERVSVQAENEIKVHADRDVHHAAIHTKSGLEGTHITACNNIIDGALDMETRIETQTTRNNSSKHTTTVHTHEAGSHHESAGDYTAHANGQYISRGATFATERVSAHGKQGTTFLQATDTTKYASDYKKDGGLFGHSKVTHTESNSSHSRGVTFNTTERPVISASEGSVILETPLGVAPILQARDEATIRLSESRYESTISTKGSNLIFNSEEARNRKDNTHHLLATKDQIVIDAPVVNIEMVRGQVLDVLAKIRVQDDGFINKIFVDQLYFRDYKSTTSLTSEASIVLALAVTAATGGIASSAGTGLVAATGVKSVIAAEIISNMTAATISALSVQIAQELAECQGNLALAAKNIASTDTLKQLALSGITAGLTQGSNQIFDKIGLPDVSKADSFLKRIGYAAPRQVTRAAILLSVAALSGQDIKTAALQNARQAIAGTVGTACASEIGNRYAQGKMRFTAHKALHAFNGGVQGAIIGGVRGLAVGATGSFIAETVADVLAPQKPELATMYIFEAQYGRQLTEEEFSSHWNNQLQEYMQGVSRAEAAAKMATVVAALVTRQNINTANFTANTAVDNNFLVLASYGLATAGAAYSAYNVYNAYESDGTTAALKQLGIEIVLDVAGTAASRVVGRAVYKCGGVVYPTAQAAMNAVFDKTPGLKCALGNLTNKIIVVGEKLNQSALGKGIARAEETILKAEAQLWSNTARAKDKVLQQLGCKNNIHVATLSSEEAIIRKLLAVEQDIGINQTNRAILKDGYYEVNGMKFSEYYYNHLWIQGRQAPSLATRAILKSPKFIALDEKKRPGFLRLETEDWELIYNPITKEIRHIVQMSKPIKKDLTNIIQTHYPKFDK